MDQTRSIARKYADLLCSGAFADAFDLLAPNVKYRIIGTTPLSTDLHGRDTVKGALVPALASFKQPPQLTLKEIIVDGNRAVILASGHGIGPTGLPYAQPHYAMVLRIDDGFIADVEEYADTVAVEVALVGKKLVPA